MNKSAGLLLLCFGVLSACNEASQKPTENNAASASAKAIPNEGKILFQTKCASCHMVNKELTGPALKGVESRWPDKEKLYAFIKNSEAVIATDNHAKQLFQQYNLTPMPPHPDLTDDHIRSILDYVDAMSDK